jgi:hypothetical protein
MQFVDEIELPLPGGRRVAGTDCVCARATCDSTGAGGIACAWEAIMHSDEILQQLRSLNDLVAERRRYPAHSREGCSVDAQIAAVRAALPEPALAHHDRLAGRGLASVVRVAGRNCGGCHLGLPSGFLADMRVPGRFGVCPHCGVMVWPGEGPEEHAVPGPKPRRTENCRAA